MSQPAPSQDEAVARAVELLAEALRKRLAAHPGGHLLTGRGAIDLTIRLPLLPKNGDLARAASAAAEGLTIEVQRLVTLEARFRPGRVFCLRCGTSDCEHSAPAASREVFTGYGPSGVPRFLDLAQWLLEQQDPRLDSLYQEPPRFVAHLAAGELLSRSLLPAFRDREHGARLHGQVAAGWWPGTTAEGHPAQVAVTFQVVSTRFATGPRRYALQLVGVGPGGESLERFCHRLGRVPWAPHVNWAQATLATIGRSKQGGEPARERRVEGLLIALASRLEKDRRAEGRKTLHARERHEQGDRPTRMALADLGRAGAEEAFVDVRRDTLVVLGERGRAHVWNRRGRLVTSIRYSAEAIERRQKEQLWRPARAEELASLKAHVVEGEPSVDTLPARR